MTTNKLLVAFTMDCEQVGAHQGGPATWDLGRRSIRGYCEVLADHDLKATLFVVPQAAERYHQLLGNLASCGVEVGLHYHPQDHGYHDFLGAYTADEQHRMIEDAASQWASAVGTAPQVFRPGNFSANDNTLPILEDLGFLAGSVSCPRRNFSEVRAHWSGAPLDAHFGHRANRLLPGDMTFFEAPLTVDWESMMWGGRTPLELRLEMVDARAHGFTVRKVVERQLDQGVQPHLVAMTHSIFDYTDPAEFRRQVLDGLIGEIERAAAEHQLEPKGVTLLSMRQRWGES